MKCNIRIKIGPVLIFLIIVVSLICVFMLIMYFTIFKGWETPIKWGFNNDSSKWGDFGSYFASITGLLAFIGVLYSIYESNKQSRAADERGVFFEMLKSHKELLSSANYNRKKGIQAFEEYAIKANNYLYLYIALEVFVEFVTMKSKTKNVKFKILDHILWPFYVNNYEYIHGYLFELLTKDNKYLEYNNIDEITDEIIGKYIIDKKYDLEFFYNEDLISKIEKNYSYLLKGEFYARINYKAFWYKKYYNSMSYVANYIYDKEGNYLGQYYRNIYYLLEVISKFDNSKFYSNIFRAHLSRSEVLMLLYNVISKKSSSRVVELYEDSDIFNNIDYNYVLGCKAIIENEPNEDNKKKLLKEFIDNLLKEFSNDPDNEDN